MKYRVLATILFFTLLIGTAHADPLTYYFGGTLNDSFGTIESGSIFTGSFSYDGSWLLSGQDNPINTYVIDNISLTFGTTTISEGNYRVFLDVGDSPTMDRLGIRTSDTFDDSPLILGGLGLYYMHIRLFDIFATALDNNDLPGPNLTIDNFNWARSITLQSTYPYTSTAYGTVTYLSTAAPAPALAPTTIPLPEPVTILLLGTGLACLVSARIRKTKIVQ